MTTRPALPNDPNNKVLEEAKKVEEEQTLRLKQYTLTAEEQLLSEESLDITKYQKDVDTVFFQKDTGVFKRHLEKSKSEDDREADLAKNLTESSREIMIAGFSVGSIYERNDNKTSFRDSMNSVVHFIDPSVYEELGGAGCGEEVANPYTSNPHRNTITAPINDATPGRFKTGDRILVLERLSNQSYLVLKIDRSSNNPYLSGTTTTTATTSTTSISNTSISRNTIYDFTNSLWKYWDLVAEGTEK